MSHHLTALIIALLLGMMPPPKTVLAQEWQAVVLKASSIKDDGSGKITVKLKSGATIRVPKTDWSKPFSDAVDTAIRDQQSEKAARSNASPPSSAAAASLIRSKCASEWPDDFRMRKYCQDQQNAGLQALRSRTMTGVLAKVRSKCASEWPNDFRMRDYCEKQQIEAYRQLSQ